MRILLDTHALIWWGEGSKRLSVAGARAIDDADVRFVSAVTAMEIITKVRLGKLPGAERLARDFESMVVAADFQSLSITTTHARVAGSLAIAHKDPFDRLLAAQALEEGLVLISNEAVLDEVGLTRVW